MNENELSYKIIGSALQLHRAIGPGLLESAYEAAMAHDLRTEGFSVQQQLGLPFIYKSVQLEVGYRVDLLVTSLVIVEIKSVDELAPVHFSQLLTYLKLSKIKLGLLINFNVVTLRDGIHRVVNNL